MQYFYLLIALFGGVVLPVQVGLNTIVAKATGNPIWASTASFFVGTVGLIGYLLLSRQAWPTTAVIATIPAYAWGAGLLGAFYVTISILVAPKIGAALLVSLAIAGQMLAALILDHYGAFGFPQHSINWGRVAGALMLTGGVVLMRKF
jgi:bacterial/archaeal transporter family-2 protein